MLHALRLIVGVVALLMLLAGLAALITGGVAGLGGLWLVVLGAAGVIAVAFERMRYGSDSGDRAGGAGIDIDPLEPRFRATDERFTDPTTRRRVRVWLDPGTGERRYRPDE